MKVFNNVNGEMQDKGYYHYIDKLMIKNIQEVKVLFCKIIQTQISHIHKQV